MPGTRRRKDVIVTDPQQRTQVAGEASVRGALPDIASGPTEPSSDDHPRIVEPQDSIGAPEPEPSVTSPVHPPTDGSRSIADLAGTPDDLVEGDNSSLYPATEESRDVSPPVSLAPGAAALPRPVPAVPPGEAAHPSNAGAVTTTPGLSGSRLEVYFPIPNAMAGKPFDAVVTLTIRKATGLPAGVQPGHVSIISRQIDGLERVGLRAEPVGEKIRIYGEPREPGDHQVTISFTVHIRGKYWHTASQAINLTVNPDPRSLWKELEPDPSSPFRRPHAATKRIVGGAVMLAASRRGRSHANKGEHRDDEFRLGSIPELGWYYLAVADGAGSATLSRRGAELACDAACEEAHRQLLAAEDGSFPTLVAEFAASRGDDARKLVRNVLYRILGSTGNVAYRRIVAEAKGAGRPPEDYATTLIFTIARPFDFGWFVAAIAVGDGGVGIYRKGAVSILNRADSGEFAGQTRFLTMGRIWADGEEILGRIRFEIVPELTAIVAMTDGVSDPKFPTERAFGDAGSWDDFWGELSGGVELTKANERADEELLEWLNFWAVGSHDDRTIAILLP